MYSQALSYIAPLLLSAAVLAVLAWYTWRRRPAPGAVPLTLLHAAGFIWTLSYALSLGLADPSVSLIWANVRVIGMTAIPPLWLMFALEYSGQERLLTGRRWAFLLLLPLVTNALCQSSPEVIHLASGELIHLDLSLPVCVRMMVASQHGFRS